MSRPVLALLTGLACFAATASPSQSRGDIRLPPEQDVSARDLARRLGDGDVNLQVFTAEHAARLCYRAARANPSNAAGHRDRDGLTPAGRLQFAGCVERSGYRLRGG